jgi:hypothetical protein
MILSEKPSKEQAKDTGMAMAFLCLLVWIFTGQAFWPKLAAILLIVDMIIPLVFYPLAIVWFGLAHVLGTVVSKILLSVIFFLVVLPVALIRRSMGYDSLKLRV